MRGSGFARNGGSAVVYNQCGTVLAGDGVSTEPGVGQLTQGSRGKRKADNMRIRAWALACAMAVFAPLLSESGYAGVADAWVETHALLDGFLIGEHWQIGDDPADYPAISTLDGFAGANAQFGAVHAYSYSILSEGQNFTYSYAAAAWFDEVTVYDPSRAPGEAMDVFLNFGLEGMLGVTNTGTRPADTVTEGRAAVTAVVQSQDLGVIAHAYNMWSSHSVYGNIMRASRNWDLHPTATSGGTAFLYDDPVMLPITVLNGVEFDLFGKLSVATGASISYTGAGTFGGLGGYGLESTADFTRSMLLGPITDSEGNDLREQGWLVWSAGPTFGGPRAIPEPSTIVLVLSGFCAIALRRLAKGM